MAETANPAPSGVVESREIDGALVETFAAPGLVAVVPQKFGDDRGYLSEVYSRRRFAGFGIDIDFVQDNQSLSAAAGTIRGMHFQVPPHAQGKLVRVVRGAILDVVVDIRVGSPAFGRPIGVELSAGNRRQLYVPPGFAHGFCTLAPDTEVHYRMTEYYVPASDKGFAFDDPAVGIAWPVDPSRAVVSDKDRRNPPLRDLGAIFRLGAGP